jgi:manganese/iron transport system substrate-binding protein
MSKTLRTIGLMVAVSIIAGCAAAAARLDVVATTTIVADVVRAVAGENVELVTLLPLNADPHAYQPTPGDAVSLSEADVVFLSGANLEAELGDLLTNVRGTAVDLSTRIALRRGAAFEEGSSPGEGGDHGSGEFDPHVWFDPTNVMIWTSVIEETLSVLDPGNVTVYGSNAAAYRRSLAELDLWIWGQIGRLPYDRRLLVTDHLAFGYFAERYGFRQVGAVFPGLSTLAEPSARALAELVDTIKQVEAPAIFVGTTANPAIAETIAADTGIAVVSLYTGSLSDAAGPASSYIEFMRYDVEAIVAALER